MEASKEPRTLEQYLVVAFFEALGTAILVAGICLTAGDFVGTGMSLFIGLLITTKFTGGHLNPALSLGVFLTKIDQERSYVNLLLLYWFSQIVGGLFGGFLVTVMDENQLFDIYPSDRKNVEGAFLAEVVCTLLFVLVVLLVKSSKHSLSQDGILNALTQGIAFATTLAFAGMTSGACLNPATGMALNLWTYIESENSDHVDFLYMYIIAPMLGGLLAGILLVLAHDKVGNYLENAKDGGEPQKEQKETDPAEASFSLQEVPQKEDEF